MLGCTIGRHDSGNLRIIPFNEWHEMDDPGFPLNIFHASFEEIVCDP